MFAALQATDWSVIFAAVAVICAGLAVIISVTRSSLEAALVPAAVGFLAASFLVYVQAVT